MKNGFTSGTGLSEILFKPLFFLVPLFLIVFLLAACAAPNTTQKSGITTATQQTASPAQTLTPEYGGILRVVPRNTAEFFGYPGDMGYAGAVDMSSSCIETLCGVDTNNEFIPKLATGAQYAQDGKSITFTLRKGVKFHDGSEFDAQSVKWNLDISKKVRSAGTDHWDSIDVVDQYTIRINLKSFYNAVINDLAISSGKISSPVAYEKMGESKIHTYPVGTGPFKFVSYTPGISIKYERNDDYWGGKPYLDGIEIFLIKDEFAKSSALQSDGVDVLFSVTSETAVDLRTKGFDVAPGTQDQIGTIFPDSANADSPYSNIKVRQALEFAIDRNALKALGNGFWFATNQMSTPNTPGYISNFAGRDYDPVKAKQLLSEAGYPDGFKTTIIFSPGQSAPQDAMVALQQFLSKVGITADLQGITTSQKTDVQVNGWHNGFLVSSTYAGLSYISAISRNLEPSGNNVYVSTTRPPGWSEALEQASTAMDGAALQTKSEKLVRLIYDDATLIALWGTPQSLYAQQSYVHDAGLYQSGATFSWTPEKAWIDK